MHKHGWPWYAECVGLALILFFACCLVRPLMWFFAGAGVVGWGVLFADLAERIVARRLRRR